MRVLQEDLGRGLRLAALPDELDGGVQVRLAVGDLLGQREGVAGLDQDVQSPACDLVALALVLFDDLGHVAHWREIRLLLDEPCPQKVCS
jgi:hypothetical protein